MQLPCPASFLEETKKPVTESCMNICNKINGLLS